MSDDLVHVLQRRNWVWSAAAKANWNSRLVRMPGVVRLQTFDVEADALAERDALEERARRNVNPFCCGGPVLHYQTSFDEDRLHDWLLDADIEPPKRTNKGRDWIWWWKVTSTNLNELQWAHVWKALDLLVFHEVVARPRRTLAYVVTRVDWLYDDQTYTARDGSHPVKVFRTRERAEQERQELEEEERANHDHIEDFNDTEHTGGFIRANRLELHDPLSVADEDETDYNDPASWFFYEIVEVELEQFQGGQS
jgi:hypothetical protein